MASSSEGVGLHGGQTAARAVSPGVVIVLDTTYWVKSFDYDAANHRQIGNGSMLVPSDRLLTVPPRLIAWIEAVMAEVGVPLQSDMFSNSDTNGGMVHLTGIDAPTVVVRPAARHGHCAVPIVGRHDIPQMQQFLSAPI